MYNRTAPELCEGKTKFYCITAPSTHWDNCNNYILFLPSSWYIYIYKVLCYIYAYDNNFRTCFKTKPAYTKYQSPFIDVIQPQTFYQSDPAYLSHPTFYRLDPMSLTSYQPTFPPGREHLFPTIYFPTVSQSVHVTEMWYLARMYDANRTN